MDQLGPRLQQVYRAALAAAGLSGQPAVAVVTVGHSGGGSSWTRYSPDTDLTVVVLSNLNGAREDKLVHDLATAVSRYP